MITEQVPSSTAIEKTVVNLYEHTPENERKYAQEVMGLLDKYTGQDLFYHIALKSLECLSYYKYIVTPYEPSVVRRFNEDRNSQEWKQLTKDERDKVCKRFFARPDVKEYCQKKEKVDSANVSNARWLEELIKDLRAGGDRESALKVFEVYNKFPSSIGAWVKKVRW